MDSVKIFPRNMDPTRCLVITSEKVRSYYHLTLHAAAQEMGISSTALKTICKKLQLGHWPYKKLKSISRAKGAEELTRQILSGEKVFTTLNNRKKRSAGLDIDEWLYYNRPMPPGHLTAQKEALPVPPESSSPAQCASASQPTPPVWRC